LTTERSEGDRGAGPSGDSPGVSIVIPTWNGGAEFGGVLAALGRQSCSRPVELIVIDSGSTDGTLETAARHGARILHVEKDAFDHGDTRNLAIHHARAPFVVVLSQDAEPAGDMWLEALIRPLVEDDRVAAVCGRILPRPDMDLLLRRGVEGDLNFNRKRRVAVLENTAMLEALTPYEKRLFINFHDIGSCIRKSVWTRLPFPRTPFGEDLMWAHAVLENGFKLVFEPSAEVLHAHDYTMRAVFKRAWWDGWLNRRLLDRRPIGRAHHVVTHAVRGIAADLRHLARHGRPLAARLRALPRSVGLQFGIFAGLYRGARRARHLPTPRVLAPARGLKILFVVHGFPPQDLAGTEVHTLTVAAGLKNRGHHVRVFHRHAAPEVPEYRVEAGEFEGVPVYRLANNFSYRGIEETYENRHVEERFHEVLARERPDVVHFQHCLHTSVSLISLCEDLGIPTVVTLNDYWFVCPTVQMILPDRSLCRVKRAGLACIRCARRTGRAVRSGQIGVRLLGPLAEIGPALYGALVRRFPRLRRDVFEDARALMRRPAVNLAHLRRAGRVLAPSRFLRRRYLEFGLDREQIIYQRYGIHTERLRGAGKAARTGGLRVAFIGSFVWYKGLHVLIEAFRGIRAEQAALTIHGNPDAPPEVRPYADECRRLAAGSPVRFAGPLPQADLREAHRHIDVLVVPSLWYENSPLVILEAQATGTPVITSDLGGMAEMVQDGVTGFLVPRGDAAALRQRILELAADPDRTGSMAANIRAPKDVATHLAELEVVYRQEISRARPASGRVPFWTAMGGRFDRANGHVEVQWEDLALLRPRAGGRSSVTYRLEVGRRGAVRIEIVTCLLPGENDVVLSG